MHGQGAKQLHFSIKRVMEICHDILSRGLCIEWSASCRVHPVSEEMIDTMVKAGCRHICFGIETASESMMERINKKITKDQIRKAYALCEKHVDLLSTGAFMMVGNPGETQQTIDDTVAFMNTIKLTDTPGIGILTILPGTKIYYDMLQEYPSLDNIWITGDGVLLYTKENDVGTLNRWSAQIAGSGQRLHKASPHFLRGTLF